MPRNRPGPTDVPHIPLGPVDETVPVLGLGTWNMERDDRKQAVATIRRAVELGMDLIDTAEMYGSGQVETLVGEALAADGLRDEAFLVTKVLPSNASREGTVEACKASLERLSTDHVDLYLLHWESRFPIEDTMAAFRELVDEGLTRFVGVSNLELAAVNEAQAALGDDIPLVTDQVLYWLGARSAENELIPGMADQDRTVMAYSPFGSGRLPGPNDERGRALATVAERHDATAHQVALAWVMRHANVLTIPKTSSVDHLEENLGALHVALTDDDLATLDDAFPNPGTSGLEYV